MINDNYKYLIDSNINGGKGFAKSKIQRIHRSTELTRKPHRFHHPKLHFHL